MSQPIEAWSSAIRDLTPEQAKFAAASGLVSVQIAEPPNKWRLTTDSRVGIVVGDGWDIRVAPRLAIPKLMFLLGYAVDRDGWRDSIAEFADEEDLFSAIASGFALIAYRTLEPAPLRGYVSVDESSQTLRGRMRVADQLARARGLPLPLEITYDDYTADIHENRLIRGATDLLLRFPRLPSVAHRRLRRIRGVLEDVEAAVAPATVPSITRLNKRYEPAMRLACLILARSSLTSEAGSFRAASFVFDMNEVFEDFLSATIEDSLRRYGGSVRLQYGREYLDEQRSIRLIPDITWWRAGRIHAILDAKYKRLADHRFPNADGYQMLAYCNAFGLREGFLVYAQDAEQRSRSHDLRDRRTTIQVRAIDVERQPEQVLAQIDELAEEVASGSHRSDFAREQSNPPAAGTPPTKP